MKPSVDKKPIPGELVMLRGKDPRAVWSGPNAKSGIIMPGSVGLVISTNGEAAMPNALTPATWRFYTYVLWSMPCIVGWIEDGFVKRIEYKRGER